MKYKPELLKTNEAVESSVDSAESHLVSMIREQGVRAGDLFPHYESRIMNVLGSNRTLRADDFNQAIQRMVDRGWISVDSASLRLSDAGYQAINC